MKNTTRQAPENPTASRPSPQPTGLSPKHARRVLASIYNPLISEDGIDGTLERTGRLIECFNSVVMGALPGSRSEGTAYDLMDLGMVLEVAVAALRFEQRQATIPPIN